MNNITSKTYIVYLLLHEVVQSKIDFFGELDEFHNIAKVTFKCISSIESHGCSADFLHNTKTLDNLRASEDKCYHKHELCSNDRCNCFSDCKRFILIVKNMSFEINDTLGCEVQYMAYGHVIRMRATILFNGTEFLFHNNHSEIVARPESSSTKPKQTTTEGTTIAELRIVVVTMSTGFGIVLIIGCILLLIIFRIKRNKDSGKSKSSSLNSLFVTAETQVSDRSLYSRRNSLTSVSMTDTVQVSINSSETARVHNELITDSTRL